MAWDDRNENVHRDLMGVHGDELFADPLGLRKSQQKSNKDDFVPASPVPPYASRNARSTDQRGRADNAPPPAERIRKPEIDDDEEEEGHAQEPEEPGYISSTLWWLIAGGRKCCSMRDRIDLEGAKVAAQTGRPPRKEGDSEDQVAPAPVRAPPTASGSSKALQAERERERARELCYPSESSRGGAFAEHRGSRAPPEDLDATKAAPRGADRDRDRSGAGVGSASAFSAAKPAAAAAEDPRRREEPASVPAPSSSSAPKKWSWPAWCLNDKAPCIEVYVEDEDTGEGRWVQAEPQNRVVDKSGNDQFLAVEYDWDGEFFVQDFGPEHVRRRGEKTNVQQLLERGRA